MPGRSLLERARRLSPEAIVTLLVVAGAVVFVFVQLEPRLLFRNTTPAGGDMGAHVWAPAYLRDHLLPDFRLSGWTPDWYAGFPAYQFYMVVPALLIVALDMVMPYGVAFKLVTVLGVVTLPIAAWAFGRLSGMRFPGPPLLAAAAVPFLFDRSFSIYGGNIPSTLAGEFSFSISLSLALVYLGVFIRGARTGRHRALSAVLLALVGLCHVIPALFALGATFAVLLAWPGRRTLRQLAGVVPVAGLLGAFWALPFVWRRGYMTDMGWEKLTNYREMLVPDELHWALALAAAGAIASLGLRRRTGMMLTATAILFAAAFVFMPQTRLWNARLLPFWYLCVYLLAAVAIAETAKAIATLVARDPEVPVRALVTGAPLAALLVTLVFVGRPLGALEWAGIDPSDRSYIPSWVEWNYRGYEGKAAWPEYSALMATMNDVGDRRGCGRAMWEHDSTPQGHDRFGTPMALMLLPYWTDGCIGSMEGLYFESSATTPYHFLNQSELSAHPSNPQRGLPYRGFDVDLGVDHLQLLGVRYYLTISDQAKQASAAHDDLDLVATSGPWEVYEVHDSGLVESLAHEPAVITGTPVTGESWQDVAVDFYMDPAAWDVPLAASGPGEWQRIEPGQRPVSRTVADAGIGRVQTGDDFIEFDVARPGTPVLVKASYFPNWKVSGAEGPYRVTPNLMVVVPTDTEVRLAYGWTPVDLLAWTLTVAGLAGVVLLLRADLLSAVALGLASRPLTARPAGIAPSDDEAGDGDGDEPDRAPLSVPTA